MAAAFCSIVFRSAVAKASNGSSTIKDNKLAVVAAASCVNADNEMRCFSIKYCNSLCNLSPKTYSHLSWSSGCGNGIQNFQERKALITEVIDDKSIKTLSVSVISTVKNRSRPQFWPRSFFDSEGGALG
uniref:Uncharacterized protein n=1 Tax=Glossina pallidipes TaxID=7398 RepID=A0A1A9Z0P0_GLOPL